jgi:hypothetical protein
MCRAHDEWRRPYHLVLMDYLAGQGVGLVQEMKPAAEVVREFLEGAHHILSMLTTESEV